MISQFTAREPKPRRRSELGLLIVGGLTVLFGAVLASLALTNALPHDIVAFIATMAGIAIYLQVVNRRLAPDADPVLMPIALVLNGLGFVMISRLKPVTPPGTVNTGEQVAWTVIGLVLYTVVLYVVKRSRDLERYRYLMLFIAMGLLVAPLLPVVGLEVGGARLWVHFHTLEFQPIEIAKLLVVIFFASYLIEKRELFTISTRRVGDHLLPDLRAFGPIVVAAAVSLLIILGEHDIGFALLLFFVFLSMLWVTTGRWTYLVIGIFLFALGTFAASHLLYQVNERITVWLDPWKYLTGAELGYQPVQGILAIGRGGLQGTGIGLGNPGAVPVPVSDFIFAAFGEELGLFGSVAFVVAYLLIVGSGLRVALRARTDFAKLCALGLVATIGFQAFFIMAGVVRVLPLTGLTLPFVSYGGSSLLANYALFALLMRISDEGNQEIEEFGMPTWSITPGDTVIGTGGR